MVSSDFGSCKAQLALAFGTNHWFNETVNYFHIRFHPIEERLADGMRFVELAPENASTFTYEFGSILRDIGSTFSSVLHSLVKNTSKSLITESDISHYIDFLNKYVDNVKNIGVQIISAFEGNMVFPFFNIENEQLKPKERLTWWISYNNLKHLENIFVQDGCLANVVYGMASLGILYKLMVPEFKSSILIGKIGFFKQMDLKETFPHH